MSRTLYWAAAVLVMAVVTYLPRALPLTLLRRPVKSRFLRSFLYYMPFAVLGAMTFPAILVRDRHTLVGSGRLRGGAAALLVRVVLTPRRARVHRHGVRGGVGDAARRLLP